jgi:putative transposase
MLQHNGHRLRTGRYSEQGRIYLITSVTHKREPFFSDFFLGRNVVRAFRHYHLSGHVKSLAFVVMPDHIHLVGAIERGNLPFTFNAIIQRVYVKRN